MKRKKLIKKITSIGCDFVRHGGNHDWYKNPQSGKSRSKWGQACSFDVYLQKNIRFGILDLPF